MTADDGMLGFDVQKTLAFGGEVALYKEAFSGKEFALPMLSKSKWPALVKDDPAFAEKAWFSLTIGRGALAYCSMLDERGLAKAAGIGLQDVAPGYYLLGPDGKVALAYVADIKDSDGLDEKGEHWEMFQGRTRSRLKALGLWDAQSFVTRVDIDPEKLVSRDNMLGDALEGGFAGASLQKHGIHCECKMESEPDFKPGFVSAWELQGTAPFGAIKEGANFAVEAPYSEFIGAPFVNHNGLSFAKNIRPFVPVNNTDVSLGADQLLARDEILASMMGAWIDSKRVLAGLADDENQIESKGLTKAELNKIRRIAAEAHAGKVGNDKKLAFHPLKTCMRADAADVNNPESKRSMLIASRDMAIIDGQHSARNYGLLAMALKASGDIKYDGVTVAHCSQAFIRARFDALLGGVARRQGAEESEPTDADAARKIKELLKSLGAQVDMKNLESRSKFMDSMFKDFQKFGLGIRAGVQAQPVMSAKHAQQSSVIANTNTPISNASKAEHAEIALFRQFSASFNKVAEAKGKPERITTSKSSLTDPRWATNPDQVWPLQNIFGSLMAASTRLNNAGDKLDLEKLEQGRAACKKIFKAPTGRPTSERAELSESMARKFGLLLTMFGKIKSRDYELSPASLASYKQRMAAMLESDATSIENAMAEGRKESPEGGGFTAFGALTLRTACMIHFKTDPVSLSQEERVYAVGKAAMAFQAKLDEIWEKMTVSSGKAGEQLPLGGLFRTKATFSNWMILGTLQSQGEVASPQALANLDAAFDNLQALRGDGGMRRGATHNAARQALTNAIDLAKEGGDGPPLEKIEEAQLRLLMDAFPHSAPGTVDFKAMVSGIKRVAAKVRKAVGM